MQAFAKQQSDAALPGVEHLSLICCSFTARLDHFMLRVGHVTVKQKYKKVPTRLRSQVCIEDLMSMSARGSHLKLV